MVKCFMELEEIVERCKKGEQQAQSWLYKRYSRQMQRICYRFVADDQIAQDLVHDGFIIIFASIRSLRRPEKIESWMEVIMTNLALRYVNQAHSVPIISLSDLPEEQQPVDEETAPDILSIETLFTMIEKLPEGYRNIFKLSVLDGLSHKEIAELLHIAPHSSSSQLHRAKEYLKRMIVNYHYVLLIFILLLVPIGYLLFWNNSSKGRLPRPVAIVNEANGDTIVAESDHILPVYNKRKKYTNRKTAEEVVSLRLDTIIPQKEVAVDTAEASVAIRQSKLEKQMRDNGRQHFIMPPTVKQSGNWTLALTYCGGRNSTDLFPKNFRTPTDDGTSLFPFPPFVNNWNDYYSYLQQYGPYMEDQREVQSLKAIAQRNNGMIEEKQHHHLPFTVGVLLHKSLDKHWGIESGINYTRLCSDFVTGNKAFITEKQNLHYIGIPLRGTYLWGRFKRFSVYSSLGVTMEIPVSATLKTGYVIDGEMDYSKQEHLKVPLQWSVDGGLGIQYQLTPSVGIFAEPNLHYYFNDGSGLKTIRKEHPFGVSLPFGIRFSY